VRILVVDDEEVVRAAVRVFLAGSDLEVAEAATGAEGIDAYRACQADVILCDVYMPVKGGLELLRELQREFPGVKVIAMSGGLGGLADLLPTAERLGAIQALPKPFSQEQLLRAICQALETQAPEPLLVPPLAVRRERPGLRRYRPRPPRAPAT
jgi:CheY-like chemotaxis protein